MKRGAGLPLWALATILILGAATLGFINLSGITKSVTTGAVVTGVAGACSLDGNKQDLYVSAVDKGQPGTALTENYNLWYNGVFEGNVSAGATAKTVSPAGAYIALVENGGRGAAAAYYTQKLTGALPCEPSTTLKSEQGNRGGVTFKSLINNDGVTLNANTSGGTQNMSSGETVTVSITLQGNESDAYSTNPQDGRYILELIAQNSTVFDYAQFTISPNCAKTGVPTDNSTYDVAFECTDGNALFDYGTITKQLKIVAKSGQNPTWNTSSPNLVVIQFLDYEYYINSDTNQVEIGAVDEDSTQVGGSHPQSTVYVQ